MSNEGKLEKKQVGLRVELDLHMKVLKGFAHEMDKHDTDAYIRALEEAVRATHVKLTVADMKEIEKMVSANADKRKANRARKRNAK